MKYKKGSIVPRYLVKSNESKARYLIKFGADVEVLGRTIKLLSDGYAIYIPPVTHVQKKKRQRTVKLFEITDINVIGFGSGGEFIEYGN